MLSPKMIFWCCLETLMLGLEWWVLIRSVGGLWWRDIDWIKRMKLGSSYYSSVL